jgi:hypothetical protein
MPPYDLPPPRFVESSAHVRAIEFLADDTHLPVDQIAEIYQREFAKLALDANIQNYLPVLTMRKVREALRLQHNANIQLAKRSGDQPSQTVLQWCPVRNRVLLLPRA